MKPRVLIDTNLIGCDLRSVGCPHRLSSVSSCLPMFRSR